MRFSHPVMSTEEEYLKVQKHIKRRKGVYLHFGLYAIIISFLLIINILTLDQERGIWWFLFPSAAWGTFVAIHALIVFVFSNTGVFGEEWESKKIEEELAKKGIALDNNQAPDFEELDIDHHLALKKIEKKALYDERDIV